MKLQNLVLAVIAAAAFASYTAAQPVIIEGLDIRSNGIFGFQPGSGAHLGNASDVLFNGNVPGTFMDLIGNTNFDFTGTGEMDAPVGPRLFANPIELTLTYNNLDLDGDTTANDSVTFTLRWEEADFDGDGFDGNALGVFNQGFDTGFGNVNDLQVSVVNVSGTTTDTGDFIVFDGFTGAGVGAGALAAVDRTVEVNGETLSFAAADTGSFQFFEDFVDFDPTPTVMFDNSGDTDLDGLGDGGAGSLVARNYDLQFSTVEELPIVAGDFNGDDLVNAADFTIFRDNVGAADDSVINNAGDGVPGVTEDDYLVFVQNFDGSEVPQLTASVTAVPEPGALALVLGGLAGVAAGRRRR